MKAFHLLGGCAILGVSLGLRDEAAAAVPLAREASGDVEEVPADDGPQDGAVSLAERMLELEGNATHGWYIPPDLEDGMYIVDVPDDDDEETPGLAKRDDTFHPKPGEWNIPKQRPATGPPLRSSGQFPTSVIPWPADEVHCSRAARPLSIPSYRDAREALCAYCDRYQVPRRARHLAVAKTGGVVAYACNYKRRSDRPCARDEVRWVEKYLLNPHCGPFRPAFAASGDLDMRYGRAWLGERICSDRGLRDTSWVGIPADSLPDKENYGDSAVAAGAGGNGGNGVGVAAGSGGVGGDERVDWAGQKWAKHHFPHGRKENELFDEYHRAMDEARAAWQDQNRHRAYDPYDPAGVRGDAASAAARRRRHQRGLDHRRARNRGRRTVPKERSGGGPGVSESGVYWEGKYHRGAMGDGKLLQEGIPSTDDVYLVDRSHLRSAVVLKAGTETRVGEGGRRLRDDDALRNEEGYTNAWREHPWDRSDYTRGMHSRPKVRFEDKVGGRRGPPAALLDSPVHLPLFVNKDPRAG